MNEGHFTNETQSSSFDIHIKFEQETNYENMQADPLLAIDINHNYAKKNKLVLAKLLDRPIQENI